MMGSSSEMLHAATTTGVEALVAPAALIATHEHILSKGSLVTEMTTIPHHFIGGLQKADSTRQLVATDPALEDYGATKRSWGLVVAGMLYVLEATAPLISWKLVE